MRHSTKTPLLILTLLLTAALALPATAGDVDPKLQAAIFLKVLNYDGALAKRKGATVTLHVVLDEKSSSQKKTYLAAFKSINGAKAGGKTVKVVATSLQSLTGSITDNAVHVLYLPGESAKGTVDTVLQLGKSKKLPVLSGNEANTKRGAAVGIAVQGGKPKILVNLKASIAQGMMLSSKLLKLAKIIK